MKIPKMPLFAIKQTVCSKHKRNSVQGCCVKKYLTDVNNSDPDTKRAMTAAERFASEQILKELWGPGRIYNVKLDCDDCSTNYM